MHEVLSILGSWDPFISKIIRIYQRGLISSINHLLFASQEISNFSLILDRQILDHSLGAQKNGFPSCQFLSAVQPWRQGHCVGTHPCCWRSGNQRWHRKPQRVQPPNCCIFVSQRFVNTGFKTSLEIMYNGSSSLLGPFCGGSTKMNR